MLDRSTFDIAINYTTASFCLAPKMGSSLRLAALSIWALPKRIHSNGDGLFIKVCFSGQRWDRRAGLNVQIN